MTQYKQALEYNERDIKDCEYLISKDVKVEETKATLEIYLSIRRALRIADAVESGRLMMESKFEYGDFALGEVNANNALLEQLKRIGDGE